MTIRSFRRLFPANLTAGIRPAFLVAAAMVACSATSAMAQLMLTQAGIDRGFQLTTFATSFPTTGGVGPRGIDYLPNGQVLVSSLNGQIRRFNNVDGQSAVTVAPFVTIAGTDNANGMGHIGSDTSIYLAQHTNNRVIRMNADGSNQITVATIPSALGIAVHSSTGHLFVTGSGGGSTGGVFNLDPIAGTFTTVAADIADGITITPDGSRIYVANYGGANGGRIMGYNTLTNAVVFNSGPVPGGIDGVALGFGPLTGYIYSVTNDGRLWEVNLSSLTQTLIATGGSRGDLVASDPSGSGDVLLTQATSVLRLRGVPCPSAAALLALGGLTVVRRRR